MRKTKWIEESFSYTKPYYNLVKGNLFDFKNELGNVFQLYF